MVNGKWQMVTFTIYPRFTIYHSSELARLRTYPQHTLPLLPLLRSRPGGVHKAGVVRSPKSDNLSNWDRHSCLSANLNDRLESLSYLKSLSFDAPATAAIH